MAVPPRRELRDLHGFRSADCVQPAPPSASFTLSATPPSQSVARGGSVDYTVEVTPPNGFIGSVNLTVSGLPPRSNASFNPNPTSSSSNSSTLTITTSNKTKRGTFTLTIKGTSGSMASDATVELRVSP